MSNSNEVSNPVTECLKALGVSATHNAGAYKFEKPDATLLESFDAPASTTSQMSIVIECPEFSSLCPVTGQPDYGAIIITYTPARQCVESKSLKLYLMGYRQHGCFHEQIVQQICDDLGKLLKPFMLCVRGQFAARGGISINPVATYVKDPLAFATRDLEKIARGEV